MVKCKNCKGKHETRACLERPSTKIRKPPKELIRKVRQNESYEQKRDQFKNVDRKMMLDIIEKRKATGPTISLAAFKEVEKPAFELYDPSGRTTVRSYRKMEDVPDYLKESSTTITDFEKPKGVEKSILEKE